MKATARYNINHMIRISQKEAIFWRLYQLFKAKNVEFVPVFGLMGEIYCEPLGKWGYVSYECSARASELTKENPGLFERKLLRGKSGATYYGYRISPSAKPELIKDEKLLSFYRSVGGSKGPGAKEKMLKENKERVREFDREYAEEHKKA